MPNSKITPDLDSFLTKAGMRIARTSGTKIGEMIKPKFDRPINENSIVYKIPCNSCPSSYYGESGRGLKKRLTEHKNDVRAHRTSNSIVVHVDKHGHLPDWNNAMVLDKGSTKKMRKILEAAYININNNINHRDGFVRLAKAASSLVVNDSWG